jgi:excinuclease ABC subunit B
LLSRDDVIIVASVSCIYGLGSPLEYKSHAITLKVGETHSRKDMLFTLTQMQFSRTDIDFHRGTYRVRGDVVDVFPKDSETRALRIHFFGDVIERIEEIDAFLGEVISSLPICDIYPATY